MSDELTGANSVQVFAREAVTPEGSRRSVFILLSLDGIPQAIADMPPKEALRLAKELTKLAALCKGRSHLKTIVSSGVKLA